MEPVSMLSSYPIPLRVELEDALECHTCSFTLDFLFHKVPGSGDMVIFSKDSEGKKGKNFILCSVRCCLHYDKPSMLVLTNPYTCESYEAMLRVLDWLKARYEIRDFEADEKPAPYYVLYRTIIDLLEIKEDSPIIPYEQRSIQVIAETIRTIHLASMMDNPENSISLIATRDPPSLESISRSLNENVLDLHRAMTAMKTKSPDGAGLLEIAKEWHEITGDYTWDVSRELCVQMGQVVFQNLNTNGVAFLDQ